MAEPSLLEQVWAPIFDQASKWLSVDSSNVAAIRFVVDDQATGAAQGDNAAGTLYVRFKDGSVYAYSGATLGLYQEMVNAPSQGKFVWQRLRDKFPYSKVA